MSEQPSRAATDAPVSDVVKGNDNPRSLFVCRFVRIVPARFALSSEAQPPVQAVLPGYMKAVAERNNLRYTLRVLRDGYLHVYHDEDTKYSWKVQGGLIKQAEPFDSEAYYFILPAEWGNAYIAFSDGPWDEVWPLYTRDETLRKSRMHFVSWEEDKGLSSTDTLCGSSDKLTEWVEEFRKEPGFVRAVFEYDDPEVLRQYDPELGHFASPVHPATIEPRWRRTNSWDRQSVPNLPPSFHWLQLPEDEEGGEIPSEKLSSAEENEAETPAASTLRALEECPRKLSGVLALADPAGICMESAALHHYSLCAWNDFTLWYSQARTLGSYIRETDAYFPFEREATVYDPRYMKQWKQAMENPSYAPYAESMAFNLKFSGKSISEAIEEYLKSGSNCINTSLDALLEFWLEWLNGDAPYSLAFAARDYATESRSGSDAWEKLLSFCTFAITDHEIGARKAREQLEQNSPLGRMVMDRLEHSQWAKDKDKSVDDYIGLVQIILNFIGVAPSRWEISRGMKELPPCVLKWGEALTKILEQKLEDTMVKEPATDMDPVLLFLLTANGGQLSAPGIITTPLAFDMSIGLNLTFNSQLAKNSAYQELMEGSNLLKGSTIMWETLNRIPGGMRQLAVVLNHIPGFAAKAPGTAAESAVNGAAEASESMKSGVSPSVGPDRASEISTGVKSIMQYCGLFLAGASLCQALQSEFGPGKKSKFMGLFDVSASALGVLEMSCAADKAVFSRQYGQFKASFVEAAMKRNFVATLARNGPVKATVSAVEYIHLNTVARWAGFLSAIYSSYEAYLSFEQDENYVGVGNLLLGAGAILMVTPVGWVGLLVTGIGFYFAIFGKTSRIQFRIANCYLGEDSKKFPKLLALQDSKNTADTFKNYSRYEVERAEDFDPETYQALVPFSYRKKYFPDKALDNNNAGKIYPERHKQLSIDLKSFELLSHSLFMECLYTPDNLIHAHICVPFADSFSTLQVVDIEIGEYPNVMLQYYRMLSPIDNKESIKMACTYKNGLPCWYFAFKAPDKFRRDYQFASLQNMRSGVTGVVHSIVLKVTVNFNYGMYENSENKNVLDDAAAMLHLEDLAYKKHREDFTPKKKEEYFQFNNYVLISEISEYSRMLRPAVKKETPGLR